MALGDFFRINMPYGIRINEKGEIFAFNREYKPLGWNTNDRIDENSLPVFTKYKGITEKKLLKLAHHIEHGIQRDENEKIKTIFFYNDGTNPQSYPAYWNTYMDKVKELAKFTIDNNYPN